MDKQDYDKLRIMEFLYKKRRITRAMLTRQGLARYPGWTMGDFYQMIDGLLDAGFISIGHEYLPGRRGPAPSVYMVTPLGHAWIKEKRREAKKTAKALA